MDLQTMEYSAIIKRSGEHFMYRCGIIPRTRCLVKKIQAQSNVFNILPLFKKGGGENIYTKLLFLHNIYMEGDIENSNWLLLGTVTCLGISSGWYIFMVYSFVTYVF